MSILRFFIVIGIFASANVWAATQITCKSTSCSSDQPNGGTFAGDMCQTIAGPFTFNMTTVPAKDSYWSDSFIGDINFNDHVSGTIKFSADYFVDLKGNYNFWFHDTDGSVVQAYIPSNVTLPGKLVYGSAHGPIMYTSFVLSCLIK